MMLSNIRYARWNTLQIRIPRLDLSRISHESRFSRMRKTAEAMFNGSTDAVVIIDANGVIHFANPAFQRFMRVASRSSRESLFEVMGVHGYERFSQALTSVVHTKCSARLTIGCTDLHGQEISMDVALVRLDDPKSEADQVICHFRDITAYQEAEAELRNALQQQKELTDLKSKFVSMVSHELRTPLTAIVSSSELLLNYIDKLSPERRHQALLSIQSEVRKLGEMLDEVLMIGRADLVGIEFKPIPLDLRALCEDLIDAFQQTMPTPRTIELEGTEARLQGDPKLLQQLILNLLSNAVKYSSSDSPIEVRLSQAANHVSLSVTDHGIGIPMEDRERVFDTFQRGSNIGSVVGTGLGLVIVKRAVEAHGGTISVVSRVGKGTTFTVSLPC